MLSSYWSERLEKHKPSGFGDQGRTNPHGTDFGTRDYSRAVNATLLSLLQREAIEALSAPSSLYKKHSTVRTAEGLTRVDNHSGSGQVDTILIKPVRTSTNGNLIESGLLTNLEIVAKENGMVRQSRARVKRDYNTLNQLVDPGTGRLSIDHLDASGKSVLSFEPAITKIRLNDKNQAVHNQDEMFTRTTEPAGERSNCRVPYSGRSECNYILRERNQSIARSLGVTSSSIVLDVTIDERKRRDEQRRLIADSLKIKVIVRSLDGRSLASLDQEVKLDRNGNITSVDTEARRIGKGK